MERILTPYQKRKIVADYKKFSVEEVISRHGISKKLLYKLVGHRKRGQPRRVVDDTVMSQIITLHLRGGSDREVARKTGLSQDTVSRYRRIFQENKPKRDRRNKDT